MNLGEMIVLEIKKNSLSGLLFNYAEYQKLKLCLNVEEVHDFLKSKGYPIEVDRKDVMHIIDFLRIKLLEKKLNGLYLIIFILSFANYFI